jgi:hypothetical protein
MYSGVPIVFSFSRFAEVLIGQAQCPSKVIIITIGVFGFVNPAHGHSHVLCTHADHFSNAALKCLNGLGLGFFASSLFTVNGLTQDHKLLFKLLKSPKTSVNTTGANTVGIFVHVPESGLGLL